MVQQCQHRLQLALLLKRQQHYHWQQQRQQQQLLVLRGASSAGGAAAGSRAVAFLNRGGEGTDRGRVMGTMFGLGPRRSGWGSQSPYQEVGCCLASGQSSMLSEGWVHTAFDAEDTVSEPGCPANSLFSMLVQLLSSPGCTSA